MSPKTNAGRRPAAAQAASAKPVDWPALLARVGVALVLILAGALKASSPKEEFSVVIESYDLVPQGMALTLAAFLPWIELVIGWALLLGYFTRESAAAAFGLAVTFFGALVSLKLRGIDLPNCGCFGGGIHLPLWASMLLDAALACLAYLAFKKGPDGLSLDKWAAGPHT